MENTFGLNIIPANELQRLAALERYRIMDTPVEKSFDSIVQLASNLFSVPVALISLVGAETIFYKAAVGMGNMREGARGQGLCALGVLKHECTIIEDTLLSQILDKNPLVHGSFGLRFYAGAPLITHDNFVIGTVCLVDIKPRAFSEKDCVVLQGLAKVAMEQIELRLTNLQKLEELEMLNQSLAASEQRFQNILDTMAEGVGITDANGQLVYANAMAQSIFGLQESEIKQRTYDDPKWQNLRIDGSPLPAEEHPMAIMMRTRKAVYDHEISVQPPEGERFYVSINAAPIVEPATGKLTGGIGTFMDVTNRRKTLQQKVDFLSMTSHELKTPLTSLKAVLQVVHRKLQSSEDPFIAGAMDKANVQVNRMNSLIRGFLDITRLESGKLHLQHSSFDMEVLIDEMISDVKMTMATHTFNYERCNPVFINADREKISSIVFNLLSNAVKYSPKGTSIMVRCVEQEHTVRVSVTDKGMGVLPSDQHKLFERYYRVENNATHNIAGFGIGLYLSAELVRLHNGTIGVESEYGQGSTFWFELPFERC